MIDLILNIHMLIDTKKKLIKVKIKLNHNLNSQINVK